MDRKKIIVYILVVLFVIFYQVNLSKAYAIDSSEMASTIRLKDLGVIQGIGQDLRINKAISRLEALVAITRLYGTEEEIEHYSDIDCRFTDVPMWGIKYINYALHKGLISEGSSNYFGSSDTISSNEYCLLLLKVFGYSDCIGASYTDAAFEKCLELGIITKNESSKYSGGALTRGAMAVITCRALDIYSRFSDQSSIGNGVSVIELGATGNGKSDDTAAIQRALEKYDNVYIPDGVYMIDGSVGLSPKSNQVIKLSRDAVLKLIPNKSAYKSMFKIYSIRNTIIEGGTIVGNINEKNRKNTETGIGIDIRSDSASITIRNINIREFYDNGISIGDEKGSREIFIESVICSDNGREALSIRNSRGVSIEDSLFVNTKGFGAQVGISLVNRSGESINDVYISNCWSVKNAGEGMLINGEKGEISEIKIIDCIANKNYCGLYLNTCKDIKITNSQLSNNQKDGLTFVRDISRVDIYGLKSSHNGLRGVSMVVSEQKSGTKDILFNKCIFLNNSRKEPGKNDGIRIDNFDSSRLIDNVGFISCAFMDDQRQPTQRCGLTVGNDSKSMNGITVETNCIFTGNLSNDMVSNGIVTMKVPEGYGKKLNIRDCGAIGDGLTDDTDAIQRALNASSYVLVPKGLYMINAKEGLKASSSQSIEFEEGAVFKVITNSEDFYRIFDLTEVSHVKILGGQFYGDRRSHLGKSGEWGTGIYIGSGSIGIRIKDAHFEGFWGDGIYVGGSIPPKDISIENVVCRDNLRSGISITSAKDVLIQNSEFSGNSGKMPETGINIEPNAGNTCEGITINDTTCSNNKGNGINLLGYYSSIKDIVISGMQSYRNMDGVYMDNCENITIKSSKISENKNNGVNIVRDVINGNFSNVIISKNDTRGASLITSSQTKGLADLTFSNCTFANNGFSQPDTCDGIRIDLYDTTGAIRNIRFYSCSFIDNQVSSTQRYGISINTGEKVSDIIIDDTCFFRGNTKGSIKYR